MNQSNKGDRYLLVKGKAGMGNRLLCAVTGIVYGQLTNRITIVDWRDATYSDDGSNAFFKFFSCPTVFPETILPDGGTVLPKIWEGYLHEPIGQMISKYDPDKHSNLWIHRKYSIDVGKLDHDEDILVFWNYTQRIRPLRPYLRNSRLGLAGLNTSQIIGKVLTEQIAVCEEVRQRIAEFKATNWSDTVIGLHIRHTDRQTNLPRYEHALRTFLQRVPNANIFLATDNLQVNQDYHKRFANLCSTSKWYPSGKLSMHQNRTCPDRVINGIEALVDMYLLAECHYLIYPSSSTFSVVSRLLSNLPLSRVIDIERFDPKVWTKKLIREYLT